MRIPSHFLEQLRTRLAPSEVIKKRVRLTRRGRDYLGLCPFHHEKTPSFNVSDERKRYRCFGCGASGDIISFVQEIEGLSFVDAVTSLAADSGLSLPKPDPEAEKRYLQEKGYSLEPQEILKVC